MCEVRFGFATRISPTIDHGQILLWAPVVFANEWYGILPRQSGSWNIKKDSVCQIFSLSMKPSHEYEICIGQIVKKNGTIVRKHHPLQTWISNAVWQIVQIGHQQWKCVGMCLVWVFETLLNWRKTQIAQTHPKLEGRSARMSNLKFPCVDKMFCAEQIAICCTEHNSLDNSSICETLWLSKWWWFQPTHVQTTSPPPQQLKIQIRSFHSPPERNKSKPKSMTTIDAHICNKTISVDTHDSQQMLTHKIATTVDTQHRNKCWYAKMQQMLTRTIAHIVAWTPRRFFSHLRSVGEMWIDLVVRKQLSDHSPKHPHRQKRARCFSFAG